MDVAQWLRQLGRGRYEDAFKANDVTIDILRRLTADDLKEIGVGSVGHRRLLLDAIAALSGAATPAIESDRDSPATGKPGSSTAERRQLSVMFCDVVGFTALSSRL